MTIRLAFPAVLLASTAWLLAGGSRVDAAQASTSPASYDGVMKALNDAAAAAPTLVHVTTAGTSVERRSIPLVVVAPGIADGGAASAKVDGKLRVWVRAGVHGDDAEGTEAAVTLVRDMAAGKHSEWLASVVLIVTPLINPDGHARVSADNLRRRNGPDAGLGSRANANGVDIDHDYMRLDSPEARTLVDVFATYDPHAAIDLGTSDNACAGYAVAWRPSLTPNASDRLASLARMDWGPFVSRSLKTRYSLIAGLDGQFDDDPCGMPGAVAPLAPARTAAAGRRGAPPAARGGTPPGTSTARGRGAARGASADGGAADAPPPEPPPAPWTSLPDATRSFANYFALRNRVTLTGLVDGFLPFPDRVTAATRFVEEAVAFTYAASTRFGRALETIDADLVVGSSLATTWQPMASVKIEVVKGVVAPVPGSSSFARASATAASATDRTGFQPDSSEMMAAEYYIPEEAIGVVETLRRHGVQLRQLTQPTRGVEAFTVTGDASSGALDGHAMRRLEGSWQPAPGVVVPIGSWVVRMNQRLARVAFTLVEPGSSDGLVAWNVLNADGMKTYPIVRKR